MSLNIMPCLFGHAGGKAASTTSNISALRTELCPPFRPQAAIGIALSYHEIRPGVQWFGNRQ